MKKVFLLLAILTLVCANFTKAANQSDILINEIAWMGTTTSANDEWIELFNNTNVSVDLSGWAIKSSDGSLEVKLKGQIPQKGFYLLERTDNSSVPNISADLIYKGALNNSGMNLALYDNLNNIIDQADYSSSWPAGNNTTKQTMERMDSLSWAASNASGVTNAGWQTSKDPSGTPKSQNSSRAIKKVTVPIKSNSELLPKNKKIDTKSNVASTAAVENSIDKLPSLDQDKKSGSSPLFSFLITGAIILVAGVGISIWKIKINS